MTNDERAEGVLSALEAFQAEKYLPMHQSHPDELSEDLGDLICNLGHLADKHGLNFIEIVQQALGTWHAERRAPDGEPWGNDLATVTIEERFDPAESVDAA